MRGLCLALYKILAYGFTAVIFISAYPLFVLWQWNRSSDVLATAAPIAIVLLTGLLAFNKSKALSENLTDTLHDVAISAVQAILAAWIATVLLLSNGAREHEANIPVLLLSTPKGVKNYLQNTGSANYRWSTLMNLEIHSHMSDPREHSCSFTESTCIDDFFELEVAKWLFNQDLMGWDKVSGSFEGLGGFSGWSSLSGSTETATHISYQVFDKALKNNQFVAAGESVNYRKRGQFSVPKELDKHIAKEIQAADRWAEKISSETFLPPRATIKIVHRHVRPIKEPHREASIIKIDTPRTTLEIKIAVIRGAEGIGTSPVAQHIKNVLELNDSASSSLVQSGFLVEFHSNTKYLYSKSPETMRELHWHDYLIDDFRSKYDWEQSRKELEFAALFSKQK